MNSKSLWLVMIRCSQKGETLSVKWPVPRGFVPCRHFVGGFFTPDGFLDGLGQVDPTFILTPAIIRGVGEGDGPFYSFCLSVSLWHTFPRWFRERPRITTVLDKCSLVPHLVQSKQQKSSIKTRQSRIEMRRSSVWSHTIYVFFLICDLYHLRLLLPNSSQNVFS